MTLSRRFSTGVCAAVCAAVCLAAGVQAQTLRSAARSAAPSVPDGPSLRVLAEDARSVTVEMSARWATPLAAVAEADPAALDAVAVGGNARMSYQLPLGQRVPPAVQILRAEYDEVAAPEGAESFTGVAAEVVGIGVARRQVVGSLLFRVLQHVDGPGGGTLRRHRRIVARVSKPLVAAALSSGGGNPHLDVARSALADGTWHRITVPQTGVYRLTTDFLRDSLGVATPDLGRVQVYGNGGRILPALAGAPRPADLVKVPTLVAGGAVLFVAEGDAWWDWQPAAAETPGYWAHDINPFIEETTYFVRVDDPEPRRIGGAGAYPSWPDAQRVATVDARVFYERDLFNLERDGGGSGLDWLGEDLTRGTVTVLDTLPGGVPGGAVARYRTRVASRSQVSQTTVVRRGGAELASLRPGTVNTGAGNAGDLIREAVGSFEAAAGSDLSVSYSVTGGTSASMSWLDWVEATVPTVPTASGGVVFFATPGGQSGRLEIPVRGFAAEPQVWDVTDGATTRRLPVRQDGSAWVVAVDVADGARPRELVAFDPAGAAVGRPFGGAAVPVQNLHGQGGFPDYVVVTHPTFLPAAQRLADYRQATDGLAVRVVTTDQVYNEFAGGNADMRAVRDYMKFLYDRAPADRLPRYLLLMGDGHYDFRNIDSEEPQYVLPYETDNMFNRNQSLTSDDYFGLLDDDEGEWPFLGTSTVSSERIDLGIGRIPARSLADAELVVDKIQSYESVDTRGPWRTRATFVGDDQWPNPASDRDLHVQNADAVAQQALASEPAVVLNKIYTPSYPLINTARGRRRPQATDAIRESINEGTLIWNYSGHGGPEGLGDERYFPEALIDELDNDDRLAVFVTATCSFGRFDIARQQSAAEEVLFHEGGGSVAMLTTVRIVYTNTDVSGLNLGLNLELMRQMLEREPDGRPRRLGDALYRTKQSEVGRQGNNRKFNLLGDPAMRLGLPERRLDVDPQPELRAFEEATVTGSVLRADGTVDDGFAGAVEVTVFDTSREVELPEGACCTQPGGTYTVRTDRIYSGRASVTGGRFETTFLVPQDVSYSGNNAKVVAYALADGSPVDGLGVSLDAVVSAAAGTRPDDADGPDVRLFVDDTLFVSGGVVRQNALLLARLSDASGLNTVGAGVGHELLLTFDGDASTAVDVSRFYTGDLDTYRSGEVRVRLPDLAPGRHTATLTAWDAVNNSTTAEIAFVVSDAEGLEIDNVLPYPNPTAGPTRFTFEHNQPPGTPARATLRVYTVAGRPVRTLDGDEAIPGGVLSGPLVQIPWDGRDDDGDRLGSGVYLFRLRLEVDTPDGGTQAADRVDRVAIIR